MEKMQRHSYELIRRMHEYERRMKYAADESRRLTKVEDSRP